MIVVGHSLGAFTAPLVCARLRIDLLVLVAAMVPLPGELFDDWWEKAGYAASGYEDVFYHDVRRSWQPKPGGGGVTRRRKRCGSRGLSTPGRRCRRGTCCAATTGCSLPAWAKGHARERLRIEADEMAGGHYVMLSRPRELAERLDAYAEAVP